MIIVVMVSPVKELQPMEKGEEEPDDSRFKVIVESDNLKCL